jgi:Rieske Fe-S protein
VAAMILADDILGRRNPWADLFHAQRIKPSVSGAELIKENVQVAKEWVKDRLVGKAHRGAEDLAPGEGAVVRLAGEDVAAYRDSAGQLHALSPVCTHMGCVVSWNAGERSWDCPCHGSRFGIDGVVLNGPAVKDLQRKPPG